MGGALGIRCGVDWERRTIRGCGTDLQRRMQAGNGRPLLTRACNGFDLACDRAARRIWLSRGPFGTPFGATARRGLSNETFCLLLVASEESLRLHSIHHVEFFQKKFLRLEQGRHCCCRWSVISATS